jgi:hypothetical protein
MYYVFNLQQIEGWTQDRATDPDVQYVVMALLAVAERVAGVHAAVQELTQAVNGLETNR